MQSIQKFSFHFFIRILIVMYKKIVTIKTPERTNFFPHFRINKKFQSLSVPQKMYCYPSISTAHNLWVSWIEKKNANECNIKIYRSSTESESRWRIIWTALVIPKNVTNYYREGATLLTRWIFSSLSFFFFCSFFWKQGRRKGGVNVVSEWCCRPV